MYCLLMEYWSCDQGRTNHYFGYWSLTDTFPLRNLKNGGLVILSQLKKILISLPDSLLQEVDSIVTVEKINRSEFVREAMKLYIRERRRIEMRDKMKKGYQEMAEINLKLAEMCFDVDSELQIKYEEKLAECE